MLLFKPCQAIINILRLQSSPQLVGSKVNPIKLNGILSLSSHAQDFIKYVVLTGELDFHQMTCSLFVGIALLHLGSSCYSPSSQLSLSHKKVLESGKSLRGQISISFPPNSVHYFSYAFTGQCM